MFSSASNTSHSDNSFSISSSFISKSLPSAFASDISASDGLTFLRLREDPFTGNLQHFVFFLIAGFKVIERLYEEQICHLLDGNDGIGDPIRSQVIPDFIDLVFQCTRNHYLVFPPDVKVYISHGIDYAITSINEDGGTKSKKLVINNVDGDVVVTTYYHEPDWLRTGNEHWSIIQQGAAISASGGAIVRELEEDTEFNNNSNPNRTKTLSYPNLTSTWQLGTEEFPLKDDAGNDWLYYIEEDSLAEYELVGYSANNNPGVADHGVLTVTNRIRTGKLEITKILKKNGDVDATGTGTFYYAVYGEEYDPSDSGQVPVRKGSITVTTDGTATEEEDGLPYGTYYVYELTEENGTPIVSTGSGVRKVINNTIYTVTGSGTSAAVNSTTDAETELINNRETVSKTAVKTWSDNIEHPTIYFKLFYEVNRGQDEDGHPDIEDIEVAGAEVKELPSGTTSVTWDDLPEYVEEGNEYNYLVKEYVMQEGSLVPAAPEGYVKTETEQVRRMQERLPEREAAFSWQVAFRK